jgi:hypothetical protein
MNRKLLISLFCIASFSYPAHPTILKFIHQMKMQKQSNTGYRGFYSSLEKNKKELVPSFPLRSIVSLRLQMHEFELNEFILDEQRKHEILSQNAHDMFKDGTLSFIALENKLEYFNALLNEKLERANKLKKNIESFKIDAEEALTDIEQILAFHAKPLDSIESYRNDDDKLD